MDKYKLYKIVNTRDRVSDIARVSAILAIVLACIFLYIWIPLVSFIFIGGIIFALAWFVPWLGGILMVLFAGWGLAMIPGSNWGIWRQLPFYIALSVFLISGIMHCIVTLLDRKTKKEWALEK
jgi:hypothetical protein